MLISAIIFYTMFLLLLIVLFLIWRNGLRQTEAQRVLNTVAIKNAEAAHLAAEAAQSLAKRLEKS